MRANDRESREEPETGTNEESKEETETVTDESKCCLSGRSFSSRSCSETGESGHEEANHKQRSSGLEDSF